jgi:hypothetical protein
MNAHQISQYSSIGASRGDYQPLFRKLIPDAEVIVEHTPLIIKQSKKVLFIDGDGLNAAPVAAGFYDYFCKRKVAKCATTNVNTPNLYNQPSMPMIKGMAKRRISIRQYVPQLLQKQMLKDIEVLVILCNQVFLPPDFLRNFKGIIVSHQILIPRDIDEEFAEKIIPEIEAFVVSLFHTVLK